MCSRSTHDPDVCQPAGKKKMDALLLLVYLMIIVPQNDALPTVQFNYHSYERATAMVHSLNRLYPRQSHVYSIGKSVENRELWVIAIGRSPKERELLVPNVKFIASVNGNEDLTKEVLLHYAEHLLTNYGIDAEITSLLNSTVVHILPILNPDGMKRATQGQCDEPGRGSVNNKSLTESFPDAFYGAHQPKQRSESAAVMRWLREHPFVLSASLDSSRMVVSIPYNNFPNSTPNYTQDSPTPDNDVFQELANTYSFAHPKILSQENVCDPEEFHEGTLVNGTINGAAWFALNGSMEDYNYVFGSCMEIAIDIACCVPHPRSSLSKHWTDNKEALLKLTRKAHMGVRGLILDEVGNPVKNVSVMISQRMPVHVSERGEFWKLLLPGSYTLEVLYDAEVISEKKFEVLNTVANVLNVTVSKNFIRRQANFCMLPPVYRHDDRLHARCSDSSTGTSTSSVTRLGGYPVTAVIAALLLVALRSGCSQRAVSFHVTVLNHQ